MKAGTLYYQNQSTKPHNMKTSKQLFVKAVLAAVLLVTTGGAGMGQQHTAISIPETGDKIRYAGTEDNMLLFDVQLENFPAADRLQIFDNNKNLVFEEKIPANTPVRRYKILKDDIDISTVSFRLSGKSFSFTQSFSVQYRIEERVDIRKVK
jgi:hypothetical protein